MLDVLFALALAVTAAANAVATYCLWRAFAPAPRLEAQEDKRLALVQTSLDENRDHNRAVRVHLSSERDILQRIAQALDVITATSAAAPTTATSPPPPAPHGGA